MGAGAEGGRPDDVRALTSGLLQSPLVGRSLRFKSAEGGEERREPAQPLKTNSALHSRSRKN